MHLKELVQTVSPSVELAQYDNKRKPHSMPPLDFERLKIQSIVNQCLCTPIEGDASLLLRYKGKEGSVSSVEELEEGIVWNILQIQGSKSRKALRVASSLHWQECFADQWKQYAQHPEAQVEALTMPVDYKITNGTNARHYDRMLDSYRIVRNALGMRYSETEERWITDIRRKNGA